MDTTINILTEILTRDAKRVVSAVDCRDLTNKSIMITGANGLIGINFLVSVVQVATKVSGISIYVVLHSSPSKFLLPFLEMKNVTVLEGDLTDENFTKTLPGADIIIHTAGFGIPARFLKNKLDTLKINTLTTFKLLERLKSNGKFLFISSSDLYNGLEAGIFSEGQIGSTNTDHPRACYIEGKRTGETICHLYQEMGVKAISVRLSLTYGPGLSFNDNRVLPSFIRMGLMGKIDLLDSGDATRTFCYISDAIELMWFTLLHGRHAIYNIGGEKTINIRDLANLTGELLNVPVNYPEKNSGIPGAPEYVKMDLSRVLSESGKSRFTDLHDGLSNTIEWFRQLKKCNIK